MANKNVLAKQPVKVKVIVKAKPKTTPIKIRTMKKAKSLLS